MQRINRKQRLARPDHLEKCRATFCFRFTIPCQIPASMSDLCRLYSGRFLASSRAFTLANFDLYSFRAVVFPDNFAA